MRFKLDENLGRRGAAILAAAGHDAATVVGQGMTSASDSTLIERCRDENRCLVTMDLDFSNPLAESANTRQPTTDSMLSRAVHRHDVRCQEGVSVEKVISSRRRAAGRRWCWFFHLYGRRQPIRQFFHEATDPQIVGAMVRLATPSNDHHHLMIEIDAPGRSRRRAVTQHVRAQHPLGPRGRTAMSAAIKPVWSNAHGTISIAVRASVAPITLRIIKPPA